MFQYEQFAFRPGCALQGHFVSSRLCMRGSHLWPITWNEHLLCARSLLPQGNTPILHEYYVYESGDTSILCGSAGRCRGEIIDLSTALRPVVCRQNLPRPDLRMLKHKRHRYWAPGLCSLACWFLPRPGCRPGYRTCLVLLLTCCRLYFYPGFFTPGRAEPLGMSTAGIFCLMWAGLISSGQQNEH